MLARARFRYFNNFLIKVFVKIWTISIQQQNMVESMEILGYFIFLSHHLSSLHNTHICLFPLLHQKKGLVFRWPFNQSELDTLLRLATQLLIFLNYQVTRLYYGCIPKYLCGCHKGENKLFITLLYPIPFLNYVHNNTKL